MMQCFMSVWTTAFVLTGAISAYGQPTPGPPDRDKTTDRRARGNVDADTDVTYGRLNEIAAGQKIVIAVDNAPDKTFELNDKDVKVNLANGLKVGDLVKVSEKESLGKTTAVTITKHSGSSATQRGKETPEKRP